MCLCVPVCACACVHARVHLRAWRRNRVPRRQRLTGGPQAGSGPPQSPPTAWDISLAPLAVTQPTPSSPRGPLFSRGWDQLHLVRPLTPNRGSDAVTVPVTDERSEQHRERSWERGPGREA